MISKSAIAIAIAILFFLFSTSDSSLQHEIITQTPPFAYRLLNWLRMKTNTLPNLDFRAQAPPHATTGGGGAGEKVKEAVAMSLGESMATVEESARSAAQVTKEKLKDAFSSNSNSNTNTNSKSESPPPDDQHHNEL